MTQYHRLSSVSISSEIRMQLVTETLAYRSFVYTYALCALLTYYIRNNKKFDY